MKWIKIATLFLALAFGEEENDAMQTPIADLYITDQDDSTSPLYELVPHNVSFHDSRRRRLNDSPADRVVFYALGDCPYGAVQKRMFPHQIQALEARAEFMVHLGDMKIRNPSQCVDEEYQQVSNMLQESAAPVLIVPGDNDWIECDNKTEAYELWGNHFHRFHERWSSNTLQVRHQAKRPENFAFTHKGVHFIGLHVLFKSFQDYPELNEIAQDDEEWLRGEQSRIYNPGVGAVVIFAHTFPKYAHPKYKPLNELLELTVVATQKPFIFIQGDLHRFTVSNPYPSLNNFMLVSVDMGRNADPMELAVDVGSRVPFKLKRRPVTRPS